MLFQHQGFLCIGHRGSPATAPENTLRSFRHAVTAGADAIELDVHLCEGTPVVIHDEQLQRTTSGRGRVGALTLEQLQTLDAGDGERIPLLAEVLEAMPASIGINIELKGADSAGPVVDLLRARNVPAAQILLSAFDHRELHAARALAPEFARGALFGRNPGDCISAATAVAAHSAHLHQLSATPTRLQALRQAGLEVLVYTINDPAIARTLARAGARGVFTDDPGQLRRAMLTAPAQWAPNGVPAPPVRARD